MLFKIFDLLLHEDSSPSSAVPDIRATLRVLGNKDDKLFVRD